jgi:tetratricopeptide (TPR) repeat protein
LRTEYQDSVLPLIQVICTQLYERLRSRPDSDGVITHEDLDAIRGVEGVLKAFAEGALERTLRLDASDRDAFKALYTRLYSRQVDGTLTTWLASREAMEGSWNGSLPFAQVVEAAVSVRLLREDALRVEGTEPRPYVRLGHDALAKVAAAWQAERDEEKRLQQERAQVEQERKRRRQQVRKLTAGLAMAFGALGLWALHQKSLADDNAYLAEVHSRRAESGAKAARRSAQEATKSLRIASRGVDDVMTELAAVDLADIPQMVPVRTHLLNKAGDAYEQLRKENSNSEDAELQWVSARSRGRIGDVLAMLGQFRDAEAAYREAARRLETLALAALEGARSGDDRVREGLVTDIRRDLVRTQVGLAVLLLELYRLDEAKDWLRQAAEVGRALEGARDATDRGLLADIDYQRGVPLAKEAELHGSPPSRDSREARASEEAYREAIRGQEALVQEDLSQARSGAVARRELVQQRTRLGRFRNNPGKLLEADRRYGEAEREFRGVLDLVPNSESSPGPRWQYARAAHNLGTLLLGRAEGAEGADQKSLIAQGLESLRMARDLLKDLRREFTEVPQYREELAHVYANLGEVELGLKQYAQAMDDLLQAEGLTDQLVAESPNVPKHRLQSSRVCQLLSRTALSQKDAARAVAYADKSIEQLTSLKRLYPDLPSFVGGSLGRADLRSAQALQARDQTDGAREALERAIGYHRAALRSSPESPKYRRYLWDDLTARSLMRLAHRDVEGAARDAEELPRLLPDNPNSYLQAALLLVQCAERSPDRRASFHDRAMNVLREGVDKHQLDRKQLDNPHLKALGDREDFRRLRQPPKSVPAG